MRSTCVSSENILRCRDENKKSSERATVGYTINVGHVFEVVVFIIIFLWCIVTMGNSGLSPKAFPSTDWLKHIQNCFEAMISIHVSHIQVFNDFGTFQNVSRLIVAFGQYFADYVDRLLGCSAQSQAPRKMFFFLFSMSGQAD